MGSGVNWAGQVCSPLCIHSPFHSAIDLFISSFFHSCKRENTAFFILICIFVSIFVSSFGNHVATVHLPADKSIS